MQDQAIPRKNIDSIINSIRNMAQDTSKVVTSNTQQQLPPRESHQPFQTALPPVYAPNERVVSTTNHMVHLLRNIGVVDPVVEIGNLVEGIHKAHAKVDQVVRSLNLESRNHLPTQTNENQPTGNTQFSERSLGGNNNNFAYNGQEGARSLNELSLPNIPSLQDFHNVEASSLASLRNIVSYRQVNGLYTAQPNLMEQYNSGNLFARNNGIPTVSSNYASNLPTSMSNLDGANPKDYESNLIKMIPLECDPPLVQNNIQTPKKPFTETFQPTQLDLYPTRSLNEIASLADNIDQPERPKSLLYTSNYTKSIRKENPYGASLNKPKLQYPPASVVQKSRSNLSVRKQSDASSSQNPEEPLNGSKYFEADQMDYYGFDGNKKEVGLREVNQNQGLEKVLNKLRTQEHNYQKLKQQQQLQQEEMEMESQNKVQVYTMSQTGGNGRKISVRGNYQQIQNENSYGDGPSIQLDHTYSNTDRSMRVMSRQDIEKKIEQLGKANAMGKSKPKRAIPSLGGGQLVYEKKDNNQQQSLQVGKEVSSGKNMGSLAGRKKSSGGTRERNPKEFMMKDPNRKSVRPSLESRRTGYSKENYRERYYGEEEDEEEGYSDEEYEEEESEDEDEEEEEVSYEEEELKQPRQEEQDGEIEGQHESEFIIRDGRSRVENSEMIWSSHKKSRLIHYM